MKGLNEKLLNDYLNVRDTRVNGRYLAARVFRGTIQSVVPNVLAGSAGTSTSQVFSFRGLYWVTVMRNGDSVPDLTRYACSIQGYIPRAGDIVDLMWQAKDEAAVLDVVDIGSPPTVAAVVAMDSISVQVGTTDFGGIINFTPTAAQAAGVVLLTVTFARAFPFQPFVMAVPARGQTDGLIQPYYDGSTNSRFQVATIGALTAHVAYRVAWWVIS